MKKIVFAVVVVILATSCSMQKRHYMNGYSLQWNSKKGNISVTEASYIAKQTSKTESKKVTENKTIVFSQPPTEQVTATNNTSKTLVASANKTVSAPVIKTKVNSFENSVTNHNAKIVERVVTNQESSGGDTNLIIEIILCLFPFINLIAIYLKDSKHITLNFWIDLILDCLFFLPGIVFALLVVLDVINLA